MIKPEELALIKGYTVTKEGILLNRNGMQVKGRIKDRKRDYYNFDIRIGPRKENKKVHCMIHRLQAYQKFGDKIYEKGIVVRHLNGDRYDNSYDNIDIGTNKDNKNDIPKELVSINCGQINSRRKLVGQVVIVNRQSGVMLAQVGSTKYTAYKFLA